MPVVWNWFWLCVHDKLATERMLFDICPTYNIITFFDDIIIPGYLQFMLQNLAMNTFPAILKDKAGGNYIYFS